MKKYLNLLIALIILFFFTGCHIKDIFGDNKEADRPAPYTIVLCDFTSSIDTLNSIKKIKTNALKIFSAEAATHFIEYYIISKTESAGCLFKSFPLDEDHRPSEDRALLKARDSLKYLLDSVTLDSHTTNRNEPNSSIIGYMGRAITYFESYKGHDTIPLQLFILSDMLECTTIRGRGTLCLENSPNINSQIALIPSIMDTSLSFNKFKHIDVYPVLSRAINSVNYGLEFERFWGIVFKKYGYKKPPFTTSLPVFIENAKSDQ